MDPRPRKAPLRLAGPAITARSESLNLGDGACSLTAPPIRIVVRYVSHAD